MHYIGVRISPGRPSEHCNDIGSAVLFSDVRTRPPHPVDEEFRPVVIHGHTGNTPWELLFYLQQWGRRPRVWNRVRRAEYISAFISVGDSVLKRLRTWDDDNSMIITAPRSTLERRGFEIFYRTANRQETFCSFWTWNRFGLFRCPSSTGYCCKPRGKVKYRFSSVNMYPYRRRTKTIVDYWR